MNQAIYNLSDNNLTDLKDPIELIAYDPNWSIMAEIEMNAIKAVLKQGWVIDIQHVGSTAIPNIMAKPIIDIYIGIKSMDYTPEIISAIQSLGYQYWDENPDKSKLFFVKGMPPFGNKRTHHIHVVEHNCDHWQAVTLFRDYMRNNANAAQQYQHIKLQLMQQFRFDREAYTAGKTEFVVNILTKLGFPGVTKIVIKNTIARFATYFKQLRQTIHANPELRYEEHETAALVARELIKMGLSTTTGIGGTGVIAILDSGKPGKTVALRADMDALPISETTNLPYQSKNVGKMHACGHDGHTASLLATAFVLTQLKDKFSGKIKFIFQPAEEGGAGAAAMIRDGVLKNPDVDAIFAFHNYPGYETGSILTKTGCIFYGNVDFTITLRGKGGHAAMPNLAIDPISIGAAIIQSSNNIVRRLTDPADPIILSITQFNSGNATNIIPDTAILRGTIRASSAEKKAITQQLLATMVTDIANAHGATATIEFKDLYPATINTTRETELVLATATELFGKANVHVKPVAARAAEDFSFFLEKIPGCYFLIGNGKESASCHNSNYNFNDAVLPIAAEMLATTAINYLSEK